MLTSATGEETLTPNPNECNSILTSGTRGIYPHCYIDVDERGDCLRAESPVTNLPRAPSPTTALDCIFVCKVSV